MSREMKHSGIPWIGEIPKEWELKRLKYLCSIQTGNKDTQDADCDGEYPFYVRSPLIERSTTYSFEGESILMAGDGVGAGRVFHHAFGKYAVHQRVYILSNITDIHSYYLFYYISNLFNKVMDMGSAQSTVPSVRLPMITNFMTCVPPLSEQQKIASFLDEKCSEIDEMVVLQEKIIEELKAYKQSVITEAVTKGLNPDVPMKDSGIEWIGEIPENWEKHPFKAFYKTTKGLNITKDNLVEKGVPVISYGQIHSKLNTGVGVREELIRFVPEYYLESNPECLSKQYDLFFADTSEDREGAGNIVFIDTETPIFAGYHTIIARPLEKVKSKYFAYLIKTNAWRSQIRNKVQGVKLFSISQKFINQTYIIIPSLQEQQSIVSYLDKKCSDIDSLINIKQEKIESLKEYKKSIIYEYVTGKKEVI